METSQSKRNLNIQHQGLVDDNIYGYELSFGPSWISFGRPKGSKLYIIYMIGTSEPHRNQGHATRLIDTFFKMVKRDGGMVQVESYTSAGEIYIKHVIKRMAAKHGIRIVK